MRRNKGFTSAILLATYFNPEGQESVIDVNKRFGEPFKEITLRKHIERHMKNNAHRWIKIYGLDDEKKKRVAIVKSQIASSEKALENTLEIVEKARQSTTEHEIGLDEFIEQGRQMLASNRLAVTGTTFLQAIKIKAEIEKSNKDRKLDAMKTLFSGMGKKDEPK